MKANRTRTSAGMLAACVALASGISRAETCTWTDGWDTVPSSPADAVVIASGGNLVWDAALPATVASWTQAAGYAGTVTVQTVYGTAGFTNFTVNGNVTLLGGAWTHAANTTVEANRLCVTINGDLFVSNAVLHADARGYNAGQGPGKGATLLGGAHGGAATRYDYVSVNDATYGSIHSPTNLGSGGAGAKGGGAVWVTVTGTTTLAAGSRISARGADTSNGAGAGGSILLTTARLNGAGDIRADGGNASNSGDGGGGRVALVLTDPEADFAPWSGAGTAYGGSGRPPKAAAGTVYRRAGDGSDSLIIDNNNAVTYTLSTRMPPGVDLNSFDDVTIRRQGVLGLRADTALDVGTFAPTCAGPGESLLHLAADDAVTYPADWLIDGYTVLGDGISKPLTNLTIGTNGVLSHLSNVGVDARRLTLTLAGNLTVRSNGAINVTARGFYAGKGPGAGQGSYRGGAHGGTALYTMNKVTYTNLNTYGSVIAPTNHGSGGSSLGATAWGGGVVSVSVSGTTTVETAGMIVADGQDFGNAPGSGGSVYLRTGRLAGGGVIRAHGGASANQGNAGGGRVAVVLTAPGADFGLWSGSVTARGGTGYYGPAGAGTVYLATADVAAGAGDVIADNGSLALNMNYTSLPPYLTRTEDLRQTAWRTRNIARVGLTTNAAVRAFTLETDGMLELAGYTLTLKAFTFGGKTYSSGVFTPASVSQLTDAAGGGQVVVNGSKGTLLMVR